MKNIPIKSITEDIEFAKDLHNTKAVFNTPVLLNNKMDTDNNINDYYLNNLKFRDKRDWEKEKPAEIIALGCSNTFGLAIPQEYTWPSILESLTKKTVANLGVIGAGAEQILSSFLLYLDTVGTPKYVFACFPDHLRYSHIADGFFCSLDPAYSNNKTQKVISYLRTSDYITGDINIKDKIIKLPMDPKYTISTQESLSQYISSIYVIEKICKFLNIEFYWGTWNIETQKLFLNNFFLDKEFCLDKKNHVEEIKSNMTTSSSSNEENNYHLNDCKSSHSIDKKEFEKHRDEMWIIGSDRNHLGIHWQYHTAENFIKKISNEID
jgi:hypothetical protein